MTRSPGQFQILWPRMGKFKGRTRPTLATTNTERSAAPYYQYWRSRRPSGKDITAIAGACTWCAEHELRRCGLGGCRRSRQTVGAQDLANHVGPALSPTTPCAFQQRIFRSHAVHPELKRLWEDLYAACGFDSCGTSIPTSDCSSRSEGRSDPRTASEKLLWARREKPRPVGPAGCEQEKQN